MGKPEQRIWEKLDEWTAAGLISPEQAQAIRAHEPAPKSGPPWGILIFAGFGAVVLGLGVILLFAYNWDQMHKFAKLATLLTALLAAHGTGLFLRRKHLSPGFSEAAFLTGTMLFGAGIWLTAQIYHMSAHYPNAFLAWALGALLLAWALPSVSHGLLTAVLISTWACCEAASYDSHMLAAPVLAAVGTGWLAWRMRSPVLLAAAAVSSVVSGTVGICDDSQWIMPVLLGWTVLLAGLAWLTRGNPVFPSASSVFGAIRLILYLPLLFILTFQDFADDLLRDDRGNTDPATVAEWLPPAILMLAAAATAGFALGKGKGGNPLLVPECRDRLLAPVLLFAIYLTAWGIACNGASGTERINAAPEFLLCITANVIFIYHMIANLWIGCRETVLRRVIGGSLMLAVWVLARFSDLFDSLLIRGVMFLIMGAALFSAAMIYHRKKKPATTAHGKEN